MFTLLYNPYRVKWFTKGGVGEAKILKKHVHIVCERPLILILPCRVVFVSSLEHWYIPQRWIQVSETRVSAFGFWKCNGVMHNGLSGTPAMISRVYFRLHSEPKFRVPGTVTMYHAAVPRRTNARNSKSRFYLFFLIRAQAAASVTSWPFAHCCKKFKIVEFLRKRD